MTLTARCHCGACTLRLARKPDEIAECNCSLCRATGFRGIYYRCDEVEIAGEFDSYVRGDLEEVFLRTMRCARCGSVTHWEPLSEPPYERMGVNANLVDPAEIAGLPVRKVDGASW